MECHQDSRLVTFAAGRACLKAIFATFVDRLSYFSWNAIADGVILRSYSLMQTILKQCSPIQANVPKRYSRQLLVDRRNPIHCSVFVCLPVPGSLSTRQSARSRTTWSTLPTCYKLQKQTATITARWDDVAKTFEEVPVRPNKSDIEAAMIDFAWTRHWQITYPNQQDIVRTGLLRAY